MWLRMKSSWIISLRAFSCNEKRSLHAFHAPRALCALYFPTNKSPNEIKSGDGAANEPVPSALPRRSSFTVPSRLVREVGSTLTLLLPAFTTADAALWASGPAPPRHGRLSRPCWRAQKEKDGGKKASETTPGCKPAGRTWKSKRFHRLCFSVLVSLSY